LCAARRQRLALHIQARYREGRQHHKGHLAMASGPPIVSLISAISSTMCKSFARRQ
jgi:hypothetical protein